MLKVENVEVIGWEHAIRGLRNPMNSWGRSDSECLFHMLPNYSLDDPKAAEYERYLDDYNLNLKIGPNDQKLMAQLAKAGPVHAKYRRMIVVYLDIIAPLYWWKEFDTYKVGTVANSCSTMHKIAEKEFTLEDFSHEHLLDSVNGPDHDCWFEDEEGWKVIDPIDILRYTILMLNTARKLYIEYQEKEKAGDQYAKEHVKDYWWQMIQLLPSSYNQRRTVMLNYEVLTDIYRWRRDHKLDEWQTFCNWIEKLPYSDIITGKEG